jgi:cytochrome c oxidase subunit II
MGICHLNRPASDRRRRRYVRPARIALPTPETRDRFPAVLKSRHTIPLLVTFLVVGAITVASVLLIDWLPPQASEQAERVDTLLWFVIWVIVVLFTIVIAVLLYSAWRFRVGEDDDEDGPPVHGNTMLEVVWTVVPAVLLAVVATWAYLVLSDNEALASDRLVVDVTAEQFAWTFTYPEAGITTGDLRVPVGRQVELRMRAKDVIHDFYVPEFRVKQDVVPGITTRLVIDPNKVGTYQVICAELCGVGHGVMRSRAVVLEPAAYEQWLSDARQQVADQAQPAADAPGAAPAAETAPAAP